VKPEGGLIVKRICGYQLFIMALSFLVLISCWLMLDRPVGAEDLEPMGLEITGDGVSKPRSFSLSELQSMGQYQQVYSTINTWPSKKWYVGRGVRLRDLLALAGVKPNAQLINFSSQDGYVVTLTVKELVQDQRYLFPHFMDQGGSDGTITGPSTDAEKVEPMLAILSAEGSDRPADMNDMNALLLMFGQRAITEQTNNVFLRNTNSIEVLTTPPPEWDSPRANMESGEVASGTQIELNNKRNDADKIYYTTDGTIPNINSPIFNWSAKRWWSQRPDSLKSVNKPIEIKEGTIIKAITIGPGKADSEVVTFTYRTGGATVQNQHPTGKKGFGVTLDDELIELKVGGTFELSATDNSIDAESGLTWHSSDTRVATVDNHGLVTMVGPGSAVITVESAGGEISFCTVKTAATAMNPPMAVVDGGDKPDSIQAAAQDEDQPANTKTDRPFDVQNDRSEKSLPPQNAGPIQWSYLIKNENSGNKEKVGQAAQTGQSQWQVFEVSADDPFQNYRQERDDNIGRIIVFVILFIGGAVGRYREYAKEAGI